MKRLFIIIFLLGNFTVEGLSQINIADQSKPITLTGVVIDADSLHTVPYVSISVKNTFRGTISDNSGYFSITVASQDTLVFSIIGYVKSMFVVPFLRESKYSLLQMIRKDTILLEEVEIVAWPDEASFIRAFRDLQLPYGMEDEIFRADRELNKVLDDQYKKDQFYYEQNYYSKLYEISGFAPPNNFLNPLRWSNFIRDWREGKFNTK